MGTANFTKRAVCSLMENFHKLSEIMSSLKVCKETKLLVSLQTVFLNQVHTWQVISFTFFQSKKFYYFAKNLH